LKLHPQIELRYIKSYETIPDADLIILPGSKSVRSDLDWLRKHHWDQTILKHLRYGGRVIGICGGFQMLGQEIHDPLGLEGDAGSSTGLGLLNISTTLDKEKQLRNISGTLNINQTPVIGYEIHTGITTGSALNTPPFILPHVIIKPSMRVPFQMTNKFWVLICMDYLSPPKRVTHFYNGQG